MPRINLLPWREAARQQRRRDFAVNAGIALGVTLVAGLLVHILFENWTTDQQERNQFLTDHIAQLEIKIKEIKKLEETKAKLLVRMQIIQQLQQSRPQIVRLFDELVTAMPDGVFLTKLDQTGLTITLEGRAESNARVSALMRKIEASTWIGNPRLMLIENQDKTGTGLSHFRLSFDQVQPKAKTDGAPG